MMMKRGWRSYKSYLNISNLHSLGVLLLSEFLVLLSSGFLLFSQLISLNLFSLHSVDSFDQDSLVLVLVTLGGKVEVVVDMLVDFLLGSILSEESSEDSLSSDPENLLGGSGFLGTSSFTGTSVSAFSLGEIVGSCSCSRVDSDVSSDDETILDELSDAHSGVGKGDFVGFIGIEPESLLSALQHGSGKSLLKSEDHHLMKIIFYDFKINL